jgi:hypothetical protein
MKTSSEKGRCTYCASEVYPNWTLGDGVTKHLLHRFRLTVLNPIKRGDIGEEAELG